MDYDEEVRPQTDDGLTTIIKCGEFKKLYMPAKPKSGIQHHDSKDDLLISLDTRNTEISMATDDDIPMNCMNSSINNEEATMKIDGHHVTDLHAYDQAVLIRFRNYLFEAVEELRIRRSADVENEERLRQLVEEKQHLEHKLEEAETKVATLHEEKDEGIDATVNQYEAHIKQLKEEKVKCALTSDSHEKEIKSLKDDMRALQLSRYTVEKKLQERERELQLQTSTRGSILSELSKLQQSCTSLCSKMSELGAQHNRLELNVKEARTLNRRLMYINEHKECLVTKYKDDKVRLQHELVQARAMLDGKTGEDANKTIQWEREIQGLQDSLTIKIESEDFLRQQYDTAKEEQQQTLDSLKDAHALIDRHVESNNKYAREAEIAKVEVQELTKCYKQLQQDLEAQKKKSEEQLETFSNAQQQWNEERESWIQRLKSKEDDIETLVKKHTCLEDLNTQWASKNAELTSEVRTLKELLNKPRSDFEVQVTPDSRDAECQLQVSQTSTGAQTLEFNFCHKDVQTDNIIEPSNAPVDDAQTQTDHALHYPVEEAISSSSSDSASHHESPLKTSRSLPIRDKSIKSSSQDVIGHPPSPAEILSSSQPVITRDMSPNRTKKSPVFGASGDSKDLSPYSRFTANLKSLVNKAPCHTVKTELEKQNDSDLECEPVVKKSKFCEDKIPKETIKAAIKPTYKFQFVNIPRPRPTSVPSEATLHTHVDNTASTDKQTVKEKNIPGILQDNSLSRPKNNKRVTFAEEIEKTAVVSDEQVNTASCELRTNTPASDNSSSSLTNHHELHSDEEDCLFSDDEKDNNFELSSQVSRIETFLKSDRLKITKNK